MPSDPVKRRIVQALRKEFSGQKDKILLRNDFEELLHLYVVSTKFQGMGRRQKIQMIADLLTSSLEPDEWGRVCLMVGLTPAEAKKYWPPVSGLNGR
jgi:stress-induced morphogen